MKQTWKIINKLIGKTKKKDKLPLQFIDNGETITKPNDIANRFNNYFINVGPTLSSKIDKTAKTFKEYLGNSYTNSHPSRRMPGHH